MREWQVLACVVDADPSTNDARRFAKKFHGYVWLTRYRRGRTAKEVTLSEEETVPPSPRWTAQTGSVHVGTVQERSAANPAAARHFAGVPRTRQETLLAHVPEGRDGQRRRPST